MKRSIARFALLVLIGLCGPACDSTTVVLPDPMVVSVTPPDALRGTAIQISGTGFGTTQGSSTVKIGAVAVVSTGWSNTLIQATVPVTAVSGALVVTVGGVDSNSMHFIVRWAPVCGDTGFQGAPVAVSDGAGGAIIAWQDFRSGSNADVYAQRVDGSGNALWAANGIPICAAAGDQQFQRLIPDGSGGAFIVWQDHRSGSRHDVYVQRVNAAGVVQWTADGVAISIAAGGDKYYPQLVSDGAGGAIITWADHRNGANYDIYAQRVNGSGVVQWTADGVAISAAAGDQFNVQLLADGVGGAIFTWGDSRGASYDIYAQRVNSAGVVQWTADGVALCTATATQTGPLIVTDGGSGAIISWLDYRNASSNGDIYGQRVDGTGVPQWTADGLPIHGATSNQDNHQMVADGLGGAIVFCVDSRAGTDIYGQRVNGSGATQWASSGVAITATAGDQVFPNLIADGAGGAIVAWYDYRSGLSNIYVQRVNSLGVNQWLLDGIPVETSTRAQFSPWLVTDGASGAIVAWYESRDTSDIYAQRIFASGSE